MSERALATFLHHLHVGRIEASGAVLERTVLTRLVEQPVPALQHLLVAHLNQMLADWPGGTALQPESIPSATLWVAAVLNNLVGVAVCVQPRLFTITLRLSRAIPPATTLEAALAYHSLLRHLDTIRPAQEWQPVVRVLLERSPLTAAWLPRLHDGFDWAVLIDLLAHQPVRVAVRDRLLTLLPHAAITSIHRLDTSTAIANAEVGRLLDGLLEHGGTAMQPFVLACYEADCLLQQRGSTERPTWPLMEGLHSAQREDDPLLRRNARRVLARYRPLAALLDDETLLRPYTYLDGRFLEYVSSMLSHPTSRIRWQRTA